MTQQHTAPTTSDGSNVPGSSERNKLIGRLLVVAAALLWSTSGLFAKAPIWDPWPETIRGPLFAFWRAVFASLALWPAVRRPRWRLGLVPLAVCFVVMNVTYLSAVALTTAANAIWLQYLAPCWVLVIAYFVLHESPQRHELASLLVAVAGVGLILLFEFTQSTPTAPMGQLGVLCGLASGVTFAAVIVLMRLLRSENAAWLVALNHAVVAAVLLPWAVHLGCWPSAAQMVVLAAFGVVQMGIPYTLMLQGLRYIPSQEAVILALIEPVLMPIWVLLAWGEQPAWWTILGGMLIFGALAIRYNLPRAIGGFGRR